MRSVQILIVALASSFGAMTLAHPAAAAPQQGAPLSACVEQLSEDYTNAREGQGLDGVVPYAHLAEFTQKCRANAGIATNRERDALRCVSRHLLWARQHDTYLSEQELARVTAACETSARPVAPANAALPGFARAHGNLFSHARTARHYAARGPRGSSGLPDAPPLGSYQSSSDGSYASTAVSGGDMSFTTLIVDLASDRAILCRDRFNGGDRTYATNWSAFYSFDDQPTIERNEHCPTSMWEVAPSTLLNWRQHLLKPASSTRSAAEASKPVPPPVSPAVPNPAAQQCILGKMTAYVRDRDLKGLDSTVSATQSAEFLAQCGVPPGVQGQAAIQRPGLLPLPPGPGDGPFRFSGHCSGFTLGGRDLHDAGACPDGIELAVPTAVSNRPQKARLTLRVPNPRAPVMVLDLTAASQKYGDNDIIEFEFSPVTPLPFSWSAMDGLHCTFVKYPADGMVRQLPKIQPNATLNCGFDESRMSNIDKMRFGFFATSADVAAFRAAFIAAHDALNPGQPFVSPKPDITRPVTN
jgi:hypothetical protein